MAYRWRFKYFLPTVLMMVCTVVSAQTPLKIGVLLPMTGSLQAFGGPILHGIELAREQINQSGGVLAQPLEITTGDTQTKPQQGVQAANKLVSLEQVSALIGPMSSGVTIPVAQSVSKPNRVPEISYAATAAKITDLEDDDFLFRTDPSGAYEGKVLARVVKQKGIKQISIIYVNNDYGEGLANAFAKKFVKLGGRVLHTVSYEEDQASYQAELSAAYGRGRTKTLLLIGYVKDGEMILRQSLEGSEFDRFVLSDGMKASDLITNIGPKYMEGAFGVTKHAPVGSEAAERFSRSYLEKYGKQPPTPFIDSAYDAVYMIALAAQQAGSTTDSRGIRDALRAVSNPPGVEILPGEFSKAAKLIAAGEPINYTGAAGPQDLDDNGDVTGSYAVWTILKGKITSGEVLK